MDKSDKEEKTVERANDRAMREGKTIYEDVRVEEGRVHGKG